MGNRAVSFQTASLSPKWIRAAAIGSIWAAIEIVAGSFLHNLRVPFSGTMLSMAAVYLLVAFAMQWKEGGIIIRAGLIAAIMKSISPSAVILGPMVGIITEALILELILLLLGRNLAGFIIGGMMAVSWALVQKILSLLILYGFDLVRIAEAFYFFLVKSTGLDDLSPVYLVLLVLAVYMVAGTTAALAGYFSYRQFRKVSPGGENPTGIDDSGELPFKTNPEREQYAGINLLVIFLMLAAILYFLNVKSYIAGLASGGALIAFVLLRYHHAIRYLKKPFLWIQLILITLLASLLWEWISTGALLSREGLIVGLEISFRALVIILSFAAISVELRNPLIRSILYRNGFAKLYKSLSMAFAFLPGIIGKIPRKNSLFRYRRNVLYTLLPLADEMISIMSREPDPRENIFVVTGSVQAGKSGFARDLVDLCRRHQITVAGFIAEGIFQNGRRYGFQLSNIQGGDKMMLAEKMKRRGWIRHRDFYFNPDAFQRGEQILDEGLNKGAGLLVLDELGPMELEGKGWSHAIEKLAGNHDTPQLWVVRERILHEVLDRWHIPVCHVFRLEEITAREAFEKILQHGSEH